MRRLRFIWRRVLASAPGLFLAGLCSVPLLASADGNNSVTAPPANTPATLVAAVEAVLTVQETDAWIVQDYEDYAAAYTNLVQNLQYILSELDPTSRWSIVGSLRYNIDELLASPTIQADSNLVSMLQEMNGMVMGGLAGWAAPTIQYCISQADAINDEIVLSRVLQSATMTLEGGELPETCNCPDYGSILDDIADSVDIVREAAVELATFAEDFFNNSAQASEWGVRLDNLWNLIYWAGTAITATPMNNPDERERLEYLGFRGGIVIDALAYAWGYEAPTNYGTSLPVVDAWRNWWLGTRYNMPTNTPDRALWVQFADDAIFHLEPNIKVAVTNDIRIDIDQLLDGLTNAVFQVVTPTNNIRNEVEVAVNVEKEKAEDELDSTSDPTKESDALRQSDLSSLRVVGTTLAGVVHSYQGMFDSIPQDMPQNILIHPGWTIGGITIPSMYWNPDGEETPGTRSGGTVSRMLGYARACFRAFWGIGFVFVVFWFAAVDLAILRAAITATYFVLLGDGRGALKAVASCVSILGGMLGYKGAK